MVKPLSFKGDKKVKKRKRAADADDQEAPLSKALAPTTDKSLDEDDSWVTADAPGDVSGPVIIVLPTEPATCIACDPNGNVFCSTIENLIDGDRNTAEPHDVRQVWIANRVAGTESFSFKGHHGRYLRCDKYGILSANAAAVSPEESFLCIPSQTSAFSIQTQREKFLIVEEPDSGPPTIRGDAEEIKFSTTFRIRIQARFKPKMKAAKEEKAKAKITRRELEEIVGRKLDDDEVRKLKKARREGDFHEVALDIKVKGKHDKWG